MKIYFSRVLLWPLSACVLVAGCATQPETAGLECGAGGAGFAYGVCKALGKSDKDCAPYAVLGGVAGGLSCYGYAKQLEKRRQQLAGRENDLDAQLQYVRGLNEDGQQLNAELSKRVAEATQRTAELSAQVSRKQASAEQLAKERQRLDGEVKEASKQMALRKDALKEAKTYQARRQSPSSDLDAEIVKQDQLLADAQRQVEALASLSERI